jgi:hypothetical protein
MASLENVTLNIGHASCFQRARGRMKPATFVLSACLVVTSGVALGAGFQWRAESESWTQPAGTPTERSAESLVTPEYFGIQALKLWDFDGRACALQLEQSSFNAPSARSMAEVRFCEPKQSQRWLRADIGSGQFVTAISICTAAGKAQAAELRGVELWGAALDSAGKLKPAKQSVKLEFEGCEKWSARRTCPANSIATGVRAQISDAGSGALGLALRCHALQVAQ